MNGSVPIDIRAHDLAIVRNILRRVVPHARVWVFGSRVTGTARPASDLDLAVDAGRALTLAELASLHDAFEESDLPYTVDIVDMQTVAENFRTIIERDRVRLPMEAG